MKSKKNIKSIVVMAALGIMALFFINNSFAANTAKVNVETANLRETADANSKILKQISINTEVEVLEKSGDWYKVKSGSTTGYLRQDLITVEEETQTNTETTIENSVVENNTNQEQQPVETDEKNKQVVEDTKLKIVPSINATDIIEVKKDEKVEIIETINGWVCVQTGTTKGWIRAEKLKTVEEQPVEQPQEEQPAEEVQEPQQPVQQQEVVKPTKLKTSYINSQTVNLRKEASKSSEVVAKLSLNTAVDVYSEENGWSKVKVGEKEGYIATSLLSNKKQETTRSLETPRETTNTENTENTTNQTTKKEETTTATVPTSGKGATVVETAKNYIGSKYVYGAAGPNSFDCSGFTSYIFKQHGVSLNRTAAAQYSNGVAVSRDQLQPGDLIMFGKSGINHVGIYIGGGQIVHAANASRGVTIDTINSGYYNNNYVGARRVI